MYICIQSFVMFLYNFIFIYWNYKTLIHLYLQIVGNAYFIILLRGTKVEK